MLRNKRFQLIISILIAIALWLYVVGNVNPTITATVRGIEVEKINEDVLEEEGLSATLKSPRMVDIVIKGGRAEVNEAKRSDIRATVDVSNCDYGENETDIKIVFPEEISGVTVDGMSEKQAVFEVE